MITPSVFSPQEIEYFDKELHNGHKFYVPKKGKKTRQLFDLGEKNSNFVLYNHALKYLNKKINAVDVGCRDGEFARYLTWGFNHVYCFDYRHRPYFAGNIDLQKVTHFTVALGSEVSKEYGSGRNNFRNPVYDGPYRKAQINDETQDTILPLDYFKLQDVNLIKVDVDGMEEEVLKGATQTIEQCRPVFIIEELIMDTGRLNHQGIKFLKALGYEEVFKIEKRISKIDPKQIHTDYIFVRK